MFPTKNASTHFDVLDHVPSKQRVKYPSFHVSKTANTSLTWHDHITSELIKYRHKIIKRNRISLLFHIFTIYLPTFHIYKVFLEFLSKLLYKSTLKVHSFSITIITINVIKKHTLIRHVFRTNIFPHICNFFHKYVLKKK